MGRHQKVTAQQVRETLEENRTATISNMAEVHGVTQPTIRSRVRELRQSGDPIIHSRNGLSLIDKDDILEDKEIADMVRAFVDWNLKMVKAVMILSTPMKPLLPSLKKSLKLEMSADERKSLARSCVKLKALLDHVEAEEDFDSDK
jgi:biotin operon repressor